MSDQDLIWYVLNRWEKYNVGWKEGTIEYRNKISSSFYNPDNVSYYSSYSFDKVSGTFTRTGLTTIAKNEFCKTAYGYGEELQFWDSGPNTSIYKAYISWNFDAGIEPMITLEQLKDYPNNSAIAAWTRKAVEDPSQIGSYITTVYNKDASAYPNTGSKDGYYYKNTTPIMP